MLGERRLPDGDAASLVGPVRISSRIAALRCCKGGAIRLKRGEIPPRRQREQHVEIRRRAEGSPPASTASAGDTITAGNSRARRSAAASARRRGARAFFFAARSKPITTSVGSGSAHGAAQREAVGAEADRVGVARAARRPEQLEVVDGLEEVRLPLAVVADERHARLGKLERDVSRGCGSRGPRPRRGAPRTVTRP